MGGTSEAGDALRVVVIGMGQRGRIARHVEGADTPAVLVGAVDTTEVGRARAASFFGPELPVFASVDEALEATSPDAAIDTPPDHTHCGVASRLLAGGVAVYLEKPMAITLD
ncbi:MAG: Gfo/Idh/MocA family oxidoreductase, partial [Amnibacterium sp.]